MTIQQDIIIVDHPTLTRLSDLFAQGKVKKQYRALVHGNFESDQARGTWNTPLSKQSGGRTDPKGKGKKQEAVTRYRVLEQSPHYALLDIELFTGRKHQIRRHAKLACHPVVGDKRYGSVRAIDFLKEQRDFFGMGLQSYYLEFRDNNRTIVLNQPDIPMDMGRLLNEDSNSL
ncbi:MAG: RNA pseudouridine synthase [Desulfobacteraceae bacterium]|nr:RNA pseudouridine synthase [Desulfobacteraceae bacterium]